MSSLLDLKVGDIAVVVTDADTFYEVVVIDITPEGIIKTEHPSSNVKRQSSWRNNGREITIENLFFWNVLYHKDNPVISSLREKKTKWKVRQEILELLDDPCNFELDVLKRVLGLLEEGE